MAIDEDLKILLQRIRDNDPTLTALDFSDGGFDEEDLIALSEALEVNSTLRYINLSNNSFSEKAKIALNQALSFNKKIEVDFEPPTFLQKNGVLIAVGIIVSLVFIGVALAFIFAPPLVGVVAVFLGVIGIITGTFLASTLINLFSPEAQSVFAKSKSDLDSSPSASTRLKVGKALGKERPEVNAPDREEKLTTKDDSSLSGDIKDKPDVGIEKKGVLARRKSTKW